MLQTHRRLAELKGLGLGMEDCLLGTLRSLSAVRLEHQENQSDENKRITTLVLMIQPFKRRVGRTPQHLNSSGGLWLFYHLKRA